MKKLTAEEFATKVMENGTEIEYEDFESASRDCQIWTIYAHITEDGDLVRCCDDAEETIPPSWFSTIRARAMPS